MKKLRVLSLVIAVLIFGTGGILFSVSSNASPQSHGYPISWNTSSLNETVLAGKTVTIPVSFTASRDLGNVAVDVVPQLAPYVSVSPSTISNLSAGQAGTIQVTLAPPATMAPQTLDGTIHIKNGKRSIAKPLSTMLVVTWETYTDTETGTSFSYPTFGRDATLTTSQETDGSRIADIAFAAPNNPPSSEYRLAFIPNVSAGSLLSWFSQEIDTNGTIIGSGNYRLRTLANGVQVLTVTGPIPENYGPLAEMYAMSPSNKTVVVLATGQANELDLLGVNSSDLDNSFIYMLKTMQFK